MYISTNTKAIARKTGYSVKEIHGILRELEIPMIYRPELRHWDIVSRADAATLITYLDDRI